MGIRRAIGEKTRCGLLCWVVFFFLGSFEPVYSASSVSSQEATEALNLLVQQFLLSNSEQQSQTFLKEILGHQGASIRRLEKLIRSGGLYPPDPPVGSLHHSINVGGHAMSYALYVPKSYNPASSYPLVVCLHGAGFVGDAYIERWVSRLEEKMLILCPTIGAGAWWSSLGEALVMRALESVLLKYHVDPDRIFLTGMSNGGIGAYLVGIFHSDRFAAIAPMAAGIPDEIFPYLKNFSTTGLYIIHGEKDQVMPVALSRKVSNYLKNEAIPHTYREHDKEHPMAGGHFFPKDELPALIDWLHRQQRISDPAKVVSVRDKTHLMPYFWTEINETSGKIADIQRSIFENEDVELVKAGAFPFLIAEVEGNHVRIDSSRVKKATLFFNDRLIDFSKSVIITAKGRTLFEGKLTESTAFLLGEAKRRKDRNSFYTASVEIDLPEAAPKGK
ncbi:MAG: alpha/beta hydrolase-fold protein [Nitrospiria bacterium]